MIDPRKFTSLQTTAVVVLLMSLSLLLGLGFGVIVDDSPFKWIAVFSAVVLTGFCVFFVSWPKTWWPTDPEYWPTSSIEEDVLRKKLFYEQYSCSADRNHEALFYMAGRDVNGLRTPSPIEVVNFPESFQQKAPEGYLDTFPPESIWYEQIQSNRAYEESRVVVPCDYCGQDGEPHWSMMTGPFNMCQSDECLQTRLAERGRTNDESV